LPTNPTGGGIGVGRDDGPRERALISHDDSCGKSGCLTKQRYERYSDKWSLPFYLHEICPRLSHRCNILKEHTSRTAKAEAD
jgi:hypothetical protein